MLVGHVLHPATSHGDFLMRQCMFEGKAMFCSLTVEVMEIWLGLRPKFDEIYSLVKS